jgi:hypothetical protein
MDGHAVFEFQRAYDLEIIAKALDGERLRWVVDRNTGLDCGWY